MAELGFIHSDSILLRYGVRDFKDAEFPAIQRQPEAPSFRLWLWMIVVVTSLSMTFSGFSRLMILAYLCSRHHHRIFIWLFWHFRAATLAWVDLALSDEAVYFFWEE